MKLLIITMTLILAACSNVRFEAINDPNDVYGTKPGLLCELYSLPANLDRTPELGSLTPDAAFTYVGAIDQPVGTFYTNGLNVIPAAIRSSYLENFAVYCGGYLRVDNPGYYTIQVVSDDGSEIDLDGEILVLYDVNSYSTMGSATRHLDRGIHRLGLLYRQGPRNHIAWQIKWNYNYTGSQIIPSSNLVH